MYMDAFGVVLLTVASLIIIYSLYNIVNPNSEYNKNKKKISLSEKPFKGIDDTEYIKKKFAKVAKTAQGLYYQLPNSIKTNNDEQEKSKHEDYSIKYQRRRPSIDDHSKAIDGTGIEMRVIGMKYRPIEAQLAAKGLDSGDVVILKHEINEFSKTDAIAVYTTTRILIGYIPSEKSGFVMSLFYDDRLPAYVKTPWEYDKSWFSIVIPGSE